MTLDDLNSLNVIRDIKYQVECKKKIPLNRQFLIFGGKGLENDTKLEEYNIKVGSTLHLIDLETYGKDHLALFFRKSTGGTFFLTTKQSAFVKDLKQKIEDKEDIPIKRQRLVFAGKDLDDETALSEYNLSNQCVLHLVIEDGGDEGVKQPVNPVDMLQNDDNVSNEG
eukprot:517309_1